MTSSRSRGIRVLAWSGTTLGAAAIGALAGGLVEARSADGAGELIATIGYSGMAAWPALAALTMIVRGLWRAWRPTQLGSQLVEEHGGAPRLAGWIAYGWIAAFVVSWATFNTISQLAFRTAFKPTMVALVVPPIVTATVLLLALASRPAVDALSAIARRMDRWCHRKWQRTPFTPRVLLIGAIVALIGLALFGWFVSVRPRLGYIDLGILIHPAVALPVTAAVLRIQRRPVRFVLAVASIAVAAAMAFALWLREARPVTLLQVWARPTIASEVIDAVYYLEDVRSDIAFLVDPPDQRPGTTPRDIVLVTIDTVRADHTPVGGGRASMPKLAELGANGAVFTAAFAPGNVTRRSIPSIATGVSPPRIRGKVAGWALRLDPRHVLVAERFRAAGYDTAGFFCCTSFWGAQHRLGINRGIDHIEIEPEGALLAELAKTWLTRRQASATRPLFLWVHFIDSHNWLEGRTDVNTVGERRQQYDKVLGEVDGYLAKVLEAFPTSGDKAPIVVVTADHGEGLGDHGQPYHSSDLYDSQIHVPLVISGPGIPPHRVLEPVSLTGIAPTLLELAGFVPPGMPLMDGTSFGGLAMGQGAGDPNGGYAFAAMIEDRSVAKGMRTVIRGRWKLIEGRKGFELYDRASDPAETRNLATTRTHELAEMRQLLEARRAIDGRSPFDPP